MSGNITEQVARDLGLNPLHVEIVENEDGFSYNVYLQGAYYTLLQTNQLEERMYPETSSYKLFIFNPQPGAI